MVDKRLTLALLCFAIALKISPAKAETNSACPLHPAINYESSQRADLRRYQEEERTEEELNPLEITTTDPLLPNPAIERPLSPLERKRIAAALNDLDAQARAELKAGNKDEAFTIWYRELRVWREFGRLEEINVLGRVGEIAFQENRKQDVQIITERLEIIQAEIEKEGELSPDLLQALGKAYEQVKAPGQALNIYEKILAKARQVGDITTEKAALNVLGKFHLAWFDYCQAANTYNDLLFLAQQESDTNQEVAYLEDLAYIYEQDKLPSKKITIQRQLEQLYFANQKYEKLASLKISLGDAYETLEQLDLASQNYQEAFQAAWTIQQFALASEAFQKLAQLYYENGQPEAAIEIYQELLKIDNYGYNDYSRMETFDKMAKIYLEQENYQSALQAYENGLAIATSLGYQQTYFQTQIERLKEKMPLEIN
ncbi:MAG: tetratricopeptide repeat protein [Spirulinaceae cyanobacterium]